MDINDSLIHDEDIIEDRDSLKSDSSFKEIQVI